MERNTTVAQGPPRARDIHGAAGEAAPPEGDQVIAGRFGTMTIAAHTALTFPRGLLGFGEVRRFALAEIDEKRWRQFKVLQCLDDHDLAFAVVVLDPDAGLIAPADLDRACEETAIARDGLAVLLIVSVRKTEEGVLVTANLRAPLLIDTARRVGVQHVLADPRYPVRYPL